MKSKHIFIKVGLYLIIIIMIINFNQNINLISKNSNKIILSSTIKDDKINDFILNNEEVEIFTSYKRYSCEISKAKNIINSTFVYEVDNKFELMNDIKLINGRFIYKSDIERHSLFAVIGSNLAKELFATYDCIGYDIYISNIKYEVIGVYAEDYSLTEKISRTEMNSVFIPIKSDPNITIIKTKNNTSSLLTYSLENLFNNVNIINLNTSSSFLVLLCKVFILISLIYFLKIIFNFIFKIYIKYLYVKKNKSDINLTFILYFKYILLILISCGLFIMLDITTNIQDWFYVFDLNNIYTSIINHFIKNNSSDGIIVFDKFLIRYSLYIITLKAIIFFLVLVYNKNIKI